MRLRDILSTKTGLMLSGRQVAQTSMLRGVRTGYAKRNHKDTYSSGPLLVMGSLICGSALGFGCCENTKKKKIN